MEYWDSYNSKWGFQAFLSTLVASDTRDAIRRNSKGVFDSKCVKTYVPWVLVILEGVLYTKEENKNKSKIKPKRYYTIMYARDTRDTRARRPYQI